MSTFGAAMVMALGLVDGGGSARGATSPAWQDWSEGAFARARRENRFVLLDLGAVWCHWCHVMEETTYRDPAVVALIEKRFVAVRVDQDARPDLSNRYEDYGWPATIVFDAAGHELVKFSGYIPPPRMASLLAGIIEDPTPGPSVRAEVEPIGNGAASLPPALREELLGLLVSRYDTEHEGWGFAKKFMDFDAVEYSMARAERGDAASARRARATLDAERRLIDPVWGGVYQYSDSGDWDHPHFEKLLSFQADALRLYAQAYALWRDPRDLASAGEIHRYMKAFLRDPGGAFYVSQDADLVQGEHGGAYFALDDGERRRRGLPRVDTHRYARETAWAGVGLVALHAATGDPEPLEDALAAARFVRDERALPGGGYRHDDVDAAGPYLGDTAAALRLFVALYPATGDRRWLTHAREAAGFIDGTFRVDGVAGFVTAKGGAGSAAAARPQRDENIAVARAADLLANYTGDPAFRRIAEHAFGYLAIPDVARRPETGGVLLVDEELRQPPLHVTIVGPRDDARTKELVRSALAIGRVHKRVEVWDRREGPLPNPDVNYPTLPFPAAFVCVEGRCSAPARSADELQARLQRLGP